MGISGFIRNASMLGTIAIPSRVTIDPIEATISSLRIFGLPTRDEPIGPEV